MPVMCVQVLAHDENIGYEDLSNRVVIRLNGVDIRNIKQLAELVESRLRASRFFSSVPLFPPLLQPEYRAHRGEERTLHVANSYASADGFFPLARLTCLREPFVDLLSTQGPFCCLVHLFGDWRLHYLVAAPGS